MARIPLQKQVDQKHIDFLTDIRMFITRGDIDSIVNVSAGIRYNF